MNKHKLILLTFIQCCFLLPIKAVQLPWYEIEILVFEQSNQTRLTSEKWTQPEQQVNVNSSLDFITPSPSSFAIKELCINGKIMPVINRVKVTEIINEDDEELLIAETSTTFTANADANSTTDNNNTTKSLEPFVEEKPFVILDKSANQLNQVMTNLKRRSGYHPLIHMTWRQPVENKQKSQLIRLFAGTNYSEKFNPEGDAKINIAKLDPTLFEAEFDEANTQFENSPLYSDDNNDDLDGNDKTQPFQFHQELEIASIDPRITIQKQLATCQQIYQMEKDKKVPDVWQLDGNIRIYAERYLHLETDLRLSIPGKKEVQLSALETSLAADKILNSLQLNDDSSTHFDNTFGWQLEEDFLLEDQNDGIITQEVLNRYALQQNRRLRRNETHYIDHPLFGILIQIRPYEGNLQVNDELEL